ncbi:MAG: class I SAM-dependent methyltransferase [Candidatus Omnitrophica bacterium]|nr:class I SAM-dependent methyltransferase [Candidatus Omnitrophota bacterium]
MQNQDQWFPSKFVLLNGKLIGARDPNQLRISSRFIADILADLYSVNIPLYVRGKVVDLGCGKVPLYAAYKNYATNVTCVDWEYSVHKTQHLDIQCNLNEKLPFNDNAFDTIILSDVLEHISRPESFMKEMIRILTPGGKALISTPFYYCIHEAPYDYYRYTEYGLKYFAESAGFGILLIKAVGGSPEIMTDFLAKHFEAIPFIGTGMAILLQNISAFLVKTRLVMKISAKTSAHFPLGYFMVVEKPIASV